MVVEIQTYMNQVLTLLNSLQLSRNEQQVCSSFNIIATVTFDMPENFLLTFCAVKTVA